MSRRGEICADLLQDLIGGAKFTILPFQFSDPILLGAREPGPLPRIAFGLRKSGAKAVRRAAKLWRYGPIRHGVAGVIGAILPKQPHAALAEFCRMGGVKRLFVMGLIL
nr:hypothetical protein [Oceaniglobus ichthyenteri]